MGKVPGVPDGTGPNARSAMRSTGRTIGRRKKALGYCPKKKPKKRSK